MNQDDANHLSNRMTECMVTGDAISYRALWAADAVLWHSFDGVTLNREELVQSFEGFVSNFPQRRLKNVRVTPTPTGFVQEHEFEGETTEGRRFTVPSCIVATIEGGRLHRVHEYVDATPVLAALGAQAS